MTTPVKLVLAGLLGVGSIIGLGSQLLDRGSVQQYVASNFTTAPDSSVPGATASTRTYSSTQNPRDTADRISREWKPAQRQDDGAGSFLRYSDRIVGITPAAAGNGSFVTVENDSDGYAHYFPYLGGFWGTTSGTGETFRGGGPGAGK